MILKGNARAGAIDLALHLSNELDNEKVEVHTLRGAASLDLFGAFREWELICLQTKAKKPFYSLSINPDPAQREWTDREWKRAIETTETKLGLSGQPCAVVFHHKVGESDGQLRKHCHVVWSRIDARTLKAVHMSNDRYKLKSCAKDLSNEFGLELRYGQKDKSKGFDLALSQGHNRDPETAAQRKQKITALWETHSEPDAFVTAMRKAGYIVARGDRRTFVAVDIDGEVHSLARQIKGVKVKDVKSRLGDVSSYPDVETAKAEQGVSRKAQIEAVYRKVDQPIRKELGVEQRLFAKLRRMAKRKDELRTKRRRSLEVDSKDLRKRQTEELALLRSKYRQRQVKRLTKHHRSKPTGLLGGLRVIFGYELARKWQLTRQDRHNAQEHQKRLKLLADAQTQEWERLKRREAILARLEKREAFSLQKLAKKLGVSKAKKVEIEALGEVLKNYGAKEQQRSLRLV
ncbi:MAG: hypothetical protein AAFY34_14670 [Pseudomonadota bacterium]